MKLRAFLLGATLALCAPLASAAEPAPAGPAFIQWVLCTIGLACDPAVSADGSGDPTIKNRPG